MILLEIAFKLIFAALFLWDSYTAGKYIENKNYAKAGLYISCAIIMLFLLVHQFGGVVIIR